MTNQLINIKFITDELLATLKHNSNNIEKLIQNHPDSNKWLDEYSNNDPKYIEKKFKIYDFKLVTSKETKDFIFENSLILYESLKDLPKYILSDERFWLWIMLEKGYTAAIEMMPPGQRNAKNIFKDHWLFGQGKKRSLVFTNVLSRHFFNALLTYEVDQEDPFRILRYTSENFNRYRNLTFRSSISLRNVTRGVLKAQMEVFDLFSNKYYVDDNKKYYEKISLFISRYSSVHLLDIVPEDHIKKIVFNHYIDLILKEMETDKKIDYNSSFQKHLRNEMRLKKYLL